MILQSLVEYYEALAEKGEITKPGWCRAKVSYALELSADGDFVGIIPLKKNEKRGKKEILAPQVFDVPEMQVRTVGVASNFLCDNSSYFLGIDNKGKPKRSKECFQSAKKRHLEILRNVESIPAKAVCGYFEKWKPEEAADNPVLKDYLEDIMAGANLVFSIKGEYAHEDAGVAEAWKNFREQTEKGMEGICLVTGKRTEIARTHGTVKGVPGAQSSGALLVSFNAPSFLSYEKEQGYNAPIGKYAAYAYTTALNYLLADKKHTTTIGDTTVIYWSEDGGDEYRDVFAQVTEPDVENQEIVDGVFKNLEKGWAVDTQSVLTGISPDKRFYILGLAPNAARLAVRFFYQDSFGNIIKHIKEHYDRLEIVRPAADKVVYMGIWRLLQETANKKSKEKKPNPNMAGAVYRAMVSGGKYPASLYQNVLGRIRAEQDNKDMHIYKITRGRAAIIKAYLLKCEIYKKEEITVGLEEDSKNAAYTLGREFAVLEAIQEEANPEINATIKDRYFNAACATPATIFPILFKLKNSHIKKIKQKSREIYYEELLGSLQDKLSIENQQTACPRRLNLEEQGMFILGYYHQTQKRYEKKSKEDTENGGDN